MGEGKDRFDSEQNFFYVRKRFENKKVDAAFFKRHCLFVKNGANLFRLGMARLNTDAERPNRAGDQYFAGGGFARFAGNFHAAAVEALNFVAKAQGSEFEAIRTKCIGLDDLRAGVDVSLLHAKDRFRL